MGGIQALWATAIVGLLSALCPATSALAQIQAPSGAGGRGDPVLVPTEDTLETTYGLAMGAGVRAGATAISALAYNTSNMAAVSTYHVEAFSQIIPGSKSNGGTYWTIGSSVTDSTTSKKIAVGTSFEASSAAKAGAMTDGIGAPASVFKPSPSLASAWAFDGVG